jgi:DNA-binding NtrC family response regulator
MLRFDRFLVARAHALDLASGCVVELDRVDPQGSAPLLFASRRGRTLIDLEPSRDGRIEIWEHWQAGAVPKGLAATIGDFAELLDCARHGAPRAIDLPGGRNGEAEYFRRALAREARLRGWVPVAVELLAAFTARRRRWPSWLADRSLVVFVDASGLSGDAVLALLKLAQRDVRPHVLVRALGRRRRSPWPWPAPAGPPAVVHEAVETFGKHESSVEETAANLTDLSTEAAARWALMIEDTRSGPAVDARTLDLAKVLIAREQPFEARALMAQTGCDSADLSARRAALQGHLQTQASAHAVRQRGWEVVDEFVGVLQICQEVEDESTALARVGSFLRDRLQASTVAFVVREGRAPRVLTRVGCDIAGIDLAMQSMDAGVTIPASRDRGPAETACPVRHATEVIGALWCRWSVGTPVATEHANTLLGVAAAAAAPSVRLAIARTPLPTANQIPELVGDSQVMGAVREAVVRAAASPFPVVIEGESGSGKEIAARAIHARSARRDRRFCPLNCAALVDDLVEAELFGHVRGAFTGAGADRRGVFEEASGGTLFLDEIAELSARVQAKLLRTLQEGEIRRLGESLTHKVDARVVAATNRPLAAEVEARRFRQDLWYRLDVIRIVIPPLRQRLDDVPLLVRHIWTELSARTGSRSVLSTAAVGALAAYDWPGNVRELQNVLASVMVAAPRMGVIGPSVLPQHVGRAAALERASTLDAARRQFEERYVRAALARAGGSAAVAARELGVTRQGFAKLMSRLGIEK